MLFFYLFLTIKSIFIDNFTKELIKRSYTRPFSSKHNFKGINWPIQCYSNSNQ